MMVRKNLVFNPDDAIDCDVSCFLSLLGKRQSAFIIDIIYRLIKEQTDKPISCMSKDEARLIALQITAGLKKKDPSVTELVKAILSVGTALSPSSISTTADENEASSIFDKKKHVPPKPPVKHSNKKESHEDVFEEYSVEEIPESDQAAYMEDLDDDDDGPADLADYIP